MSHHHKTSLPLGLAAILAAAPALAAPTPGAMLPVSHNEQGNFRLPADDLVRVADAPPAPPPPPPAPCPADANGNGAVNSADVSAYLARWMRSIAGGTLEADFDGSGTVTSSDIPAYLTAWSNAVATGC